MLRLDVMHDGIIGLHLGIIWTDAHHKVALYTNYGMKKLGKLCSNVPLTCSDEFFE